MISVLVVALLAAGPKERKPEVSVDPPSVPAQLTRLSALYDSLEFEQVIKLSKTILANPSLTVSQQLEALRLQASALAVVRDPVDAEGPFRLLLRLQPGADLPPTTPPKILSVFRKVQVEERALAERLHSVERSRLIADLKLLDEPPTQAQGGQPLKFFFRLRDPKGVVETVRVPFRTEAKAAFSSLALQRTADGAWEAVLPGETTASATGLVLEYYLETADAEGVLLRAGTADQPLRLTISPGEVPRVAFKPAPAPVFWTSLALTTLTALASAGFGVAYNVVNGRYHAQDGAPTRLDGFTLANQASTASTLALATNVSLVGLAITALATVVLWPLTAFEPAN